MTVSIELPFATYAMDSYDRGYLPRLAISGSSNLTGATVVDPLEVCVGSDKKAEWIAVGFYAQAYLVGDVAIISYRGTDNPSGWGAGGSDILNGWVVGAGDQGASRARMAAEFYQSVATSNGREINGFGTLGRRNRGAMAEILGRLLVGRRAHDKTVAASVFALTPGRGSTIPPANG